MKRKMFKESILLFLSFSSFFTFVFVSYFATFTKAAGGCVTVRVQYLDGCPRSGADVYIIEPEIYIGLTGEDGKATLCDYVQPGEYYLIVFYGGSQFGPDEVYLYVDGNGDGSATIQANYEITPPAIEVLSPQNMTYTNSSVPLTFTIHDFSPISWIGYSLDGQANVTVTGNTTLSGLSYGRHNVVVYANDTFGNMGASNKIFFSVAIIVPDHYPTIQEAINHANPGDAIYVRNGTYHEHLLVNKRVSITGENKSTTFINGDGSGCVVEIEASETCIKGFTITNGSHGILMDFSGGNTIYGNTIENNAYMGIRCCWSSNNNISCNVVRRNGIGSFPNGVGVFLLASGNNLLRGNNITENELNFGVRPDRWDFCFQDIDTSNLVDDKPIYYWVNRRNCYVPSNAGYVGVINCSGIVVKDLTVTRNYQGCLIALSSHCVVENLITSHNYEGISFFNTSDIVFNNNTIISSYVTGVSCIFVRNSTLSSNVVSGCFIGLDLQHMDGLAISNNTVLGCPHGILGYLTGQFSSNITHNRVSGGWEGIGLRTCSSMLVADNDISASGRYDYGAIMLAGCSHFNIRNNRIRGNGLGLSLSGSNENILYHNSFINNTDQVFTNSINTWDDGYPSGGNYWSDYNGTDSLHGPYQNLTGSDGIGDIPYAIDVNNRDNYPLMKPYPWATHDIGITSVTTSKTIVGQGYNASISIMTFNYDNYTENINITIYANETMIGEINNIDIANRNFTIATFTWDTTGFAKGNYTVTATATQLPGETDTTDNTLTDGWVLVTIPGDVNGDHKVDMKDIYQLILHFMCKTGQPCYVANYNINCDGVIDIKDIYIAIRNFGKKW